MQVDLNINGVSSPVHDQFGNLIVFFSDTKQWCFVTRSEDGLTVGDACTHAVEVQDGIEKHQMQRKSLIVNFAIYALKCLRTEQIDQIHRFDLKSSEDLALMEIDRVLNALKKGVSFKTNRFINDALAGAQQTAMVSYEEWVSVIKQEFEVEQNGN